MWSALRNRRLNGLKFVRQYPIGPYYVDFVCRERRIIVEIDGATHGTEEELAYDAQRTGYLHTQGFRVFRVNNGDVYENPQRRLRGTDRFRRGNQSSRLSPFVAALTPTLSP